MNTSKYETKNIEGIVDFAVKTTWGSDIGNAFKEHADHSNAVAMADDIVSTLGDADPRVFFRNIFAQAKKHANTAMTEGNSANWLMHNVLNPEVLKVWTRRVKASTPPQTSRSLEEAGNLANWSADADMDQDGRRPSDDWDRIWAEAEARGRASAEAGPAPRYQEPRIVLEGRPSEPYWVSRIFDDLPRYQMMWTDKDMRDVTALQMNEEAEARIQEVLDAGQVPPVGRVAEWFTSISGVKSLQQAQGVK